MFHLVLIEDNGGIMKKDKCFVCKKVVEVDWPAFRIYEKDKVVCMNCEGANIEVWRVSLPDKLGGYIERDFERMTEGLKHIDTGDSLQVHKESMKVLKYLSLPDFEGF